LVVLLSRFDKWLGKKVVLALGLGGLGVQTVDVIAVCQLGLMVTGMASSRAGSLPQVGFGWSQILCMPWISVGAELARDGGVSVDINVDCAAVIASKLGSYRVVVWQAPSMVAGMASSRAGSLPQFWRG
jgi:hypothetical protein